MTDIAAFLHAHPLVWTLLVLFVVLTVLRIVARLACLAIMIATGIAVIALIGGIAKGIL